MKQTQTQQEVLCINFNQDSSMFAVGTDTGFRVFTTREHQQKFDRDLKGGIGIVEMLFRSNIMALVGGGLQPKYPENKVILWDDSQTYIQILDLLKCIGEMSFRDKIRNVKLKSDKVVVVLEKKTFVYNFSDLKLINEIETCPNIRGICAINVFGEHTILATPAKIVGRVCIQNYGKGNTFSLVAHQSPVSFLAMNSTGSRLATSSEKGTVIRIYNTDTGESVQELRRGSEFATITCLVFDHQSQWLACASDQGTIHIFGLLGDKEKQEKQELSKNPKSKLGFLGSLIPILTSEWSFAQLRIMDTKCKVIFLDEPCTFVAISHDGNFYKASFDAEKGGECIKLEEVKYLINEQNQTQLN